MTTHTVVLIPGDGIGPEVAEAVQQVLEAAKAPLTFEIQHAGVSALEKLGEPLPEATIDAIKKHGVALKGPCTTPVGHGFRSVNVTMRKRLDLYAAVRPVKSLKGVPTRYENIDLVVLRENTEGLYAGIESVITEGVVTSIKVVTEKASKRFARFAFDYCKNNGRTRLTAMHKANILKLGDGLFTHCAREVRDEFTAKNGDVVAYDELIIDAGCMRLVQDPNRFDTLLLQNLNGDVLSDLCAGFVGGLGVAPGANIGDECAMFEAVHGSAPDIAGQGIANPLSLLMSSLMMLRHLDKTRDDNTCVDVADAIENAFNQALVDEQKTGDLGGSLNTKQFVQAVIERF